MSDITSRYKSVSAQYAAVVGARERATATVVERGPDLMRQMRRDLDQHAMRVRSKRTVTRSVLIVDDHEDLRVILRELIESSLKVPVFVAGSVAEGRMQWDLERCAVVVCDLYLGQSFGDDLLMDLPREVRTIIISGVADTRHLRLVAAVTGSTPRQKPVESLVEDVREGLAAALPA